MRRARRRGAQAVEFALLLPVLLAILTGIMDYGWFFSQHQSLVAAVREGARSGAATPLEDDPVAAAEARVEEALTASGIDTGGAAIDATLSSATPDLLITVDASVPAVALVGLVPYPDVLTTTLVMRLEDQPDPDTGG